MGLCYPNVSSDIPAMLLDEGGDVVPGLCDVRSPVLFRLFLFLLLALYSLLSPKASSHMRSSSSTCVGISILYPLELWSRLV
jgi:hypothetical protein